MLCSGWNIADVKAELQKQIALVDDGSDQKIEILRCNNSVSLESKMQTLRNELDSIAATNCSCRGALEAQAKLERPLEAARRCHSLTIKAFETKFLEDLIVPFTVSAHVLLCIAVSMLTF